MKKMMVAAMMVLSTSAAFAQHEAGTFTLQPKVGVNISTLSDLSNTSSRIGIAAGAEGEYYVSDKLGLSLGAIYSQQGAKASINDLAKATIGLDYINVPVMANVYVAPGLAIKAGVQPGFLINSKLKGEAGGYSGDIDLDKVGIKTNTVDCSIPVGVSYEYNNIVLDARYNFGLTKWAKGFDSKNSGFQITLGFKF